jgi:iron complex transport system permease protein
VTGRAAPSTGGREGTAGSREASAGGREGNAGDRGLESSRHEGNSDFAGSKGAGGRWRARPAVVTAVTLVSALGIGVVAMTLGDFPVSVGGVVRALAGGGPAEVRVIVVELRAPRVVVGLAAGAALALAGALTQTAVRNPLASPDVLGVTAGASLGAVAAIVLGGGTYAVSAELLRFGVPVCAAAGGLVVAGLVTGLAWRRGLDPMRLVLIGVGLGAAIVGLTSWLLVVARVDDAARASVWLAGSVSSRGWDQAVPPLVALAALAPPALAMAGPLATAQLGGDVPRALGSRLGAVRLGAVVLAVGLTAAAVSAAGAIGFVGLVVPQVMLRLTGGARPPLAASAAGGALLVAGADLAGRLLWSWEVPVGLLTAALGAPYLIVLLIRERRTTP